MFYLYIYFFSIVVHRTRHHFSVDNCLACWGVEQRKHGSLCWHTVKLHTHACRLPFVLSSPAVFRKQRKQHSLLMGVENQQPNCRCWMRALKTRISRQTHAPFFSIWNHVVRPEQPYFRLLQTKHDLSTTECRYANPSLQQVSS